MPTDNKEYCIVVRQFLSLTDAEITQLVTDLFQAKKVTCIKRNKKEDRISCKVYMNWKTTDDNGKTISYTDMMPLELYDPWTSGEDAIIIDCTLDTDDYVRYRKFCLAKGICPYLENNPYLEEK